MADDINQLNAEALGAAEIRFDADDSAPTYIGINRTQGASESTAQDWVIYKFTYSGSNTTSISKRRGAWADRASLF
jgi:hypothetical protein